MDLSKQRAFDGDLCADCTAEDAQHVLAALDSIKWIRNEVTPALSG